VVFLLFTHLHHQELWLQQRQLSCLVCLLILQFFIHQVYGLLLLAQHKFNTWLLRVGVAGSLAAAGLGVSVLLQVFL
jgi:hypothetical protein